MDNEVLYEDRHFKVTSEGDKFVLHFNLPNTDCRFDKLEVESLISSKRSELEDMLNGKLEDARRFLIDQGLNYDSVGFVLAQAYLIHGNLRGEKNLPKCQSGR
ncbi:hypothetical protein HY212_07310 [Candidatus Pacearchaeota archaeon]|nr:hypothetical protein [Candidatus Pacearchaeota archaeon]